MSASRDNVAKDGWAMAKLFALGAYFYQAALAFGLLIVVARILPAHDYAGYSIFVATSQFTAISFFEWIRFACSRFYPGQTADSEAAQRATMTVEAGAAALAGALAGLVAALLGLPLELALMGVGVAVLQGGTDLHLTLVRFRRQFRMFSWLQGLRASLLATGTIGGALLLPSLTGAALGLLGAYAIYAAIGTVATQREQLPRGQWDAALAREHLSYGSVSAGASMLGLLAPLGLRLILANTLGAQAAAGALLAVDLLQRPFVLMVSALQAVQYPDVVSAHDAPDRQGLRRHLGQYYALLVTLCVLTGAGILAILVPVTELAVAPDLRTGFFEVAPLLVLLFLLRSLTQNMSTTPAHLRKNLMQMLVLALIDCLGLTLLAGLGALLPGAGGLLVIAGAAAGTVIAGLVGLKILLSLPFEIFGQPMLVAALALVPPLLLLAWPVGGSVVTTLGSIGSVGVLSLAALYALYRVMRPRDGSLA